MSLPAFVVFELTSRRALSADPAWSALQENRRRACENYYGALLDEYRKDAEARNAILVAAGYEPNALDVVGV